MKSHRDERRLAEARSRKRQASDEPAAPRLKADRAADAAQSGTVAAGRRLFFSAAARRARRPPACSSWYALPGVLGVLPHDLGGLVLVAVADRLDQAGVLAPGGRAADGGHRRVVPADPAVHLAGEVDQEPVAGHLGDQAVQLAVGPDGAVDVAGLLERRCRPCRAPAAWPRRPWRRAGRPAGPTPTPAPRGPPAVGPPRPRRARAPSRRSPAGGPPSPRCSAAAGPRGRAAGRPRACRPAPPRRGAGHAPGCRR